jgi:hypothetical protein
MRPVIQGILAALVGMLAPVILQRGHAALTSVPDLLSRAGKSLSPQLFTVTSIRTWY